MKNFFETVPSFLTREEKASLWLKRREKSGFALVIALGLMAFVVLLLISMMTMVRVESSAAATAADTLKARQNALLGLYQAIGALQRQAGPDARVTALADIFDNADASKKHWVEVWNSDVNSPEFGESLGLLVSGDVASRETPLTADDAVMVVSGRQGQLPVEVEAVEIDENAVSDGRFAWWISDEAAKASIALTEPVPAPDQHRRLLAASEFEPKLMSGFDAVSGPVEWSQAYDRSLVPLLSDEPGFGQAAAALFHDLTPRALGILADVREGGLKRDLTTGLQPGSTGMEDETGEAGIFGPQWGGSASEDPGGPLWEQLRSFYNTRVAAASGSGEVAFQPGSDAEISVAPVLTLGQVYFHALKGDVDGNTIRFYALPAFALWNPYQHRLAMPEIFVTWEHRRVESWWRVLNGSREELAIFYFRDGPPRWRIPETVWEPGEVKLFSMGEHSRYPDNPATDSDAITLTEGFFDGFGSYWENANTGTLDGELVMRRDLYSGQKFFLSTEAEDTEASAFVRVLRQDHTGVPAAGNYGAREISYYDSADAEAMATAPSDDFPLTLVDPSNHIHVPAMGYRSTMKFAKWQGESSWLDRMNSVVGEMGHYEVPFLAHYNPRSTFSGYHTRREPYWNNPLYASGYMRQFDYNDAGNYAAGFSPFFSGGGITNAAYFELLRE